MKIRLVFEFGIYVMHITDINNSIMIDKKIYEKYSDTDKITEEGFLDIIRDLYPKNIDKYVRVLESKKKVDVAKGHYSDVTEDLLTKSCFTLCLHATRRCNLNCKYCFGDGEYLPKKEISIDVAKKAIDYLVFDYGKTGKMYTIDLAGSGEPLLRFDFMQELEAYCEKLRNSTGKKIIITFPTNATLLNETHIKYLEQHPDILYGISLDGNEKANVNRVYHNGRNAFEDAMKGIEITTNEHCGFAVTITKDNENVDEIYDFLYSLKKGDAISTHIVRDFSDLDTSVYKIDIDNLIGSYKKLCMKLIKEIKKGNVEYLRPLLNGDDILGGYILMAVQKGIITKYRCDAGQNRIAVDDNGKIYACSVMNGEEAFNIGDIYNGIDQEKRRSFTKSSIKESIKCSECWCKNICRGECMTIAYMTHKELYKPNDTMCEIKQRLAELAISFAEYLKANVPEGYNFIVSHIISSRDYNQTNSAVWSVTNYLNENGYSVTYREIASVLENLPCDKANGVNLGPGIKDVEALLKEYDSSVCAVSIRSISDIKDVKKSIICYYKTSTGRNEYCLIKNQEEQLVISSLEIQINGISITDEMVSSGLKFFIGPFEENLK